MLSLLTTAVSKLMFRHAASSIWLALCLPALADAAAPVPADQLVVAGNACGPTALLNAFRFGNLDWQRAASAIAGDTDKQRIYTIIRESGMRPSHSIKGRPRWSRKGVNLADLHDIANELTRGHFLPLMSEEVLFLKPGETQEKLLRRVHSRFETSLAKGLPPIISLRRYALRRQDKNPPAWVVLDAHFVTITSVPGNLDKNPHSFPVTYIDPWGGKICHGLISIPARPVLASAAADSPCLEAVFPQALVGKKLIRNGEPTALTVAAVLGRW